MVYSEDKCFFLILEKDIPQYLCTPHAEHIRIFQEKKATCNVILYVKILF